MSSKPFTPRPGLLGLWDRLVGTNATAAENTLNLAWTLPFTTGVLSYALARPLDWSPRSSPWWHF